jgi:prepilin-type N-terminal cleavage/methylation domain-containing protein
MAWRTRIRTAEHGHGLGDRHDDGFSIVEIVATISIMAIVMAPTMGAVIAGIRASRLATSLDDVTTVMQNAADRVNRAPRDCDYIIFAQAAAQTQGWNASQVSVVQRHYVPGSTAAQNGTWADGACVGATVTDGLVQLVTITVASPDNTVNKTIEVVKSND